MYKFFLLLANLIIATLCFAQTLGTAGGSVDAKSLELLNKVSNTYKNSTGTQLDLKITLTDNKTGKSSSTTGTLKTTGNKFYLTTKYAEMVFDGKTLDVYDVASNELTVSIPSQEEVSSIDPTAIISMFKVGYKISSASYSGDIATIKLYPENKNSEVSMIVLSINTTTSTPTKIETFGKNGIDNSVEIKKVETNKNFDDKTFEFNADKHKNLQIIDLR